MKKSSHANKQNYTFSIFKTIFYQIEKFIRIHVMIDVHLLKKMFIVKVNKDGEKRNLDYTCGEYEKSISTLLIL